MSRRVGLRTIGSIGGKSVDPTLLLYWPLNEGSGAIAHDKSKYGNDGQIVNCAWIDNLLFFDGTPYKDYVARSTTPPLNSALSKCSLLFWVHPTTSPGWGRVTRGGGVGLVAFARINSGWYAVIQWSAVDITTLAVDVPTLDEWNFYALTYDGALVKAYKNLEPPTEVEHTGDVPAVDPTDTFLVGYYGGLRGYMRKVRFYSRALSVSELQAFYAEGY